MRDWSNDIRRSLAGLELPPGRESEIVEELAQHLNDRYEELLAGGSTFEQAEHALQQELSGEKLAAQLKSLLPTQRAAPVPGDTSPAKPLAGLWKDLCYGVRVLRLSPVFSIVAILSLTLGIGANTAIFQLLDIVRMRSLPVKAPQQLAMVRIPVGTTRTGSFIVRYPHLTSTLWKALAERQQAFSNLAAWSASKIDLNQGGEARYGQVLWVSGNFFATLGLEPQAGRLLSVEDDQPGCSLAAVISNSFWQREFGGAPVLDRKITLAGHPFEIIGITPASFYGMEVGRNFDIALPLCAERIVHSGEPWTTRSQMWWLATIGRLKPGWSLERASSHLATISPGIFESTVPAEYDAITRKDYLSFKLVALPAASGVSTLRQQYETPLWLLMGISGLVLLIACANLANLMLARASGRQREMAVRLALGASRARLVRQLLTESFLLAASGSLLGIGLAQLFSRLLVAFLKNQGSPALFLDMQLDWRVIGFTAGLGVLTCILFGLMPAMRATRTAPAEAMKVNNRTLGMGHERFSLRRVLVISQVAFSLVLVFGAILFVRTFRNLLTLDAGFQQEGILFADIDLTPLNLPADRRMPYQRELLEKVRSVPGVISAADVLIAPLSGSGWDEFIDIPEMGLKRQNANFNRVSAGYFKTMRATLLAGRDFTDADTISSPRVAIVTQTFARKFFAGANPVGRSFDFIQEAGKPDLVYQIVGLAADEKYQNLREQLTPIVFVAESQDRNPISEATIAVRSELPLAGLGSSVKDALVEMNPALHIEFIPYRTAVTQALLRERLMATLSGFFAGLAAVLAMIGLYGVISYMVSRRRNEIGIRMALGAARGNILRIVIGEAGFLLAIGLAIGTGMALICGKAASALLFGLRPSDPVTLLAAIAGLTIVTLAASFLPARGAAGIDPMEALREE
jgi:putative ABC transport system permease protein